MQNLQALILRTDFHAKVLFKRISAEQPRWRRHYPQLSTACPKTASEQSNTNSEKTPIKLTDMMKRVSGSRSDPEIMAKASKCG